MARELGRPLGLDLAEGRSANYANAARTDALVHLAAPVGRVLDVGCGTGASADALRSLGASRIIGIEIDPAAGEVARSRYDHVIVDSVESALPEIGEFDTVLCYDVLEHLNDPWGTVARLAHALRSDGRLHISVPNARFLRVWAPLVFQGRFGYEAEGYRDVTHLRWFTRADAIEMLERAGLQVASVAHPPPLSLRNRMASAITRGRSAEFLTGHWYLLARRK